MNLENYLAKETLKKFRDGSFSCRGVRGRYNYEFHIACQGTPSKENFWNMKWEVTILGALFLAHMKFFTFLQINSPYVNWWSNSLVEETLLKLDMFKNFSTFVPRLKRMYGFGNYEIYEEDFEFMKECPTPTICILEQLAIDNKFSPSRWSK